jgi:cell division protein FtsZ
VIDPEMGDEMRVTVVATGLGHHHQNQTANQGQKRPVAAQTTRTADGGFDYNKLQRPTVMRQQAPATPVLPTAQAEHDMDYLDIPAFLRRQEEVV